MTPAFAADSSPELAAEAVNVCATFIATGIVTDVERMGRILKLLVSALENFSSKCLLILYSASLTLQRRGRDCCHWRPQGSQLQRSGHGKDVCILSLGRAPDSQCGAEISRRCLEDNNDFWNACLECPDCRDTSDPLSYLLDIARDICLT